MQIIERHRLAPLGKAVRCKVKNEDGSACGCKSSYYCVDCSTPAASIHFVVCNPFNDTTGPPRNCWYKHIRDIQRAEELATENDSGAEEEGGDLDDGEVNFDADFDNEEFI